MAERPEFEIDARGGTVTVTSNRRAFAYDLDDLDEALARIRRARSKDRSHTPIGKGVEVTYWPPTGSRQIVRT